MEQPPTSRQQLLTLGKYRVIATRVGHTMYIYTLEYAELDALGDASWRHVFKVSDSCYRFGDRLTCFLFELFEDMNNGVT